jgi:hypothetical protein
MGGHAHGALYHSQSIEARFATPGLKIVIPSSPYEAKGLLLAAIRDPDPVLFFEHKRLYRMFKEQVPKGEYLIPLQKARTVREGTDISVFCYGLMVHYALEAAKPLEEGGVSVEVVDLRTVYPLDRDAIIASACTVCPSLARISFSTPVTGAGTSALTLSVSTSSMGSNSTTWSPGLTSHLEMVPSCTDSPSCGITTRVVPMAQKAARSCRALVILAGVGMNSSSMAGA